MPNTYVPQIEICVEGIDEALAAARAGADRVELCAGMTDGGLTPSVGVVRETLARIGDCRVMAMVRPRGGDFLYTEAEFATMLIDVAAMREMRAPGIVAGCLKADGTVDIERMQQIVAAAGPMQVTCHRAFDMTRDPFEALEALIAAGVSRVLTSGHTAQATDGIDLLRALVERAGGRIVILVCGPLTPADIDPEGKGLTGYEFHFAKVGQVPSPMDYLNPKVFMGTSDSSSEYLRRAIDPEVLAGAIRHSRGL